jgi:polyhydroxyalkanoate synthesis regulator phasin
MNTKKLEVYDKSGMKNLPFSGLNNIKNILEKEEVLYITNATKVPSAKIINAISALNKQTVEIAIKEEKELYIRSTSKGSIIIDDLKLEFKGPADFKPLKLIFSKFGKDILETHPIIRKLMDRGQLEILTRNEAKNNYSQLLEEEKEKKAALERKLNKENKEDESSSNMENMWDDKNPCAVKTGGTVRSIAGSISDNKGLGGGGWSNEGTLITSDGDVIT